MIQGRLKAIVIAALVGGLTTASAAAPSNPGLATSAARSVLIRSPEPIPHRDGRVRVFLGGSIDMGSSADWQSDLAKALQDQPVTLLNPRRADWNLAWRPVASEPEFRKQVDWELAALEQADVIVMYLAPGSQSPVSLLELGLHAKSGKIVLLCPEGFWRKGNVDITAARYKIEQVNTFEELISAVRRRVMKARGR